VSFTPTHAGAAVVRVTATSPAGLSNTATRSVTIAPKSGASDSRPPTLSVGKVKTVRRPKRSTIKGRAHDASGIARVTVRFGDGKRARAHRTGSGRFTVRHRYAHAGTFKLTVTAVDKAGNSRTRHRTVHVRRRGG
jgi:hypothetical protein